MVQPSTITENEIKVIVLQNAIQSRKVLRYIKPLLKTLMQDEEQKIEQGSRTRIGYKNYKN